MIPSTAPNLHSMSVYSVSGYRASPRVGVRLPSSVDITAYNTRVSTAQGTATSLVGAIGNTPLIELPSLSKQTGSTILGKAEFQNPGGSVKDRAALYVVKDAEERGVLKPGGTVVEGTAGNTGIGLAHVCRSRGYKLVIYMPNTQSQGKIDLLRLLGAEVYPVPPVAWENPDNYNWQAKRHAERVSTEDPEHGAVWTNQFDNVANRLAHIETTGPEIWAQTGGKIDAFTCSTGTGGTLAGITRYLKDVSGGRVKSFLADPPGSVLYSYISSGGKLKERQGGSITEGIGQGRVTDNLKDEVAELDGAVFISDEKTIEMIYRCLDEEGLYLGASSALNVVAAKEVAEKLGKGHTVVTILADGAYRYADRLFSETWLKSKGLREAIPKHLEKYIFTDKMAPPGLLLQPPVGTISIEEATDYENGPCAYDVAPPIKAKVPLRDQFKSLKHPKIEIDWVPSFEQYMQRVSRRLKQGIPNIGLPSSFPISVNSPACWSGDTLKAAEIVRTLSQKHIKEIESALAHLKGLNISKNDIGPDSFPLPTVQKELRAMAEDVHNGRGISILRGLDPANYAFEDNVLLYAGIASYIGATRGKQDKDGNVLVHIKNVGAKVAPDEKIQSPYANNVQPFHNDLGDMVVMYCMDQAASGGISRVASAATIYNELASTRPDLIAEMAAPNWVFDKHDNTGAFYKRPIVFYDAATQRAFFCFSRRQLTGSTVSPRPAHFPALTEAQAEALDAVHFSADHHSLNIQLEKGDMQFINNLALFHAREAFKDGADSQKRHLIRMWLRNEDLAWTTPKELQGPWEEIYGSTRKPVWHMSPEHGRAHVINSKRSCHG
ncbi:hypothetical protein DV736_g6445, partial [Chaetothyriales sp. CBS 134916]